MLAALAALAACRERAETPAEKAAEAPGATSAQTRILYPSAPGSFVDLIAGARHGVVAIRAAAPVRSGPAAMFPGSPDSASDVALISIDVPRLQPLRLGNSDELATGEWVVVLGNAFGDEVTASVGIVSATGREAAGSLVPGRAMGFRTFLQTDARIHRGNSGGPVLDTAGQVIGVAVATGDRPEELSFAIPINRVREALDSLRDYGTVARSWLGVLVKPVTAELAQQLGLPKPAGALVTEVKAGSPAARSALRVGDVILKWADRDVDHRSLPWIVAQTPVGRPIAIAVWRNRAELAVQLVTEKMPE
ncbi:MAG TPA: trypsin-like peptidase domain-containing protein [Kofleriaceae bacterium]|nr:trypsin-like peptidase domain-containing protein [Kofleriaceae bacterium]